MKSSERYIALMARRCREAYIRERTALEIRNNRKLGNRKPPYEYKPAAKWDGGEDDDGRTHNPIWPRLAAFFIEHGLDPFLAMRKRFQLVRGSTPPWPNQIAVETYLELYRGDKEIVTEQEVQVRFDLDKDYCRVGLTSTRYNRPGVEKDIVWKSILLDDFLEISPLMRYSLAIELGLKEVAKIYHVRALSQYMLSPKTYNKVWGAAIPVELKTEVDEIDSLVKQTKQGPNNGRQ